jgi:hypothetical protein
MTEEMLETVEVTDAEVLDLSAVETATTAQPVKPVAKTAPFMKFADSEDVVNPWRITNNRNQLLTTAYLRRYIQCWCRVENGYTENRAANLAYFMSDEFLAPHAGETASHVGKLASIDARWGEVAAKQGAPRERKPRTGKPAAQQGNKFAPKTPEEIAELIKDWELVDGKWQKKAAPVDTGSPADPLATAEVYLPHPATDAANAPMVIDIPAGVGKKPKSRKAEQLAEEAELEAIKADAIAAIAESLDAE